MSAAPAALPGAQADRERELARCGRCANVLGEWRVVDGARRVVVRLRVRRAAGAASGGRRVVVVGPRSTIICERCGAAWELPGEGG